MIQPHKVFEVFTDDRRIFTANLTPGQSFFQENLYHRGGEEFREWNPERSKLGAAIAKGSLNLGIRKGNVVLYLGAAHGYTPSFISDMIGTRGLLFGLDPAPRVMRDLIHLSQSRPNIVPLLADANHPEEYLDKICLADVVYQDVAQRNQSEIFLKNCAIFLKKGGYGLFAVKARSIDVRKKPKVIFEEVKKELEKDKSLKIIDYRLLEPYEKDHCIFICKKD